jgi:DNA-binding MarR family transcriptional regulator
MTVDKLNCLRYAGGMDAAHYRLEESLGFMTITAHRMLQSTLRRRLRAAGLELSPEQWGILVVLWERGGMTQDELTHVFCADKSSMSRVLALLEERGLVERRVDADNERRKIVRATQAALAVRGPGFDTSAAILRGAVAGLAPEEVATCLRVLAAIKDNLRDGAA